MNFYNELDKFSDKTALITENSRAIDYKNLLAVADQIAGHVENRCLIFIVCQNSFESIAGYVGFQRAGVAIALVHSNIDDDLFLALWKPIDRNMFICPRRVRSMGLLSNQYSALRTTCY